MGASTSPSYSVAFAYCMWLALSACRDRHNSSSVPLSSQRRNNIRQRKSSWLRLDCSNLHLPIFFHPRNDSASGVDPQITLEDAYSQVPRIQNATSIPEATLKQLIDANQEGTLGGFGRSYINVLHVNLELIETYPTAYADFQ